MAFKKYLVCGVSIPSADQINPELMKTAVFTWAEGEPKKPITESSCVVVSGDSRWCLANCADIHYISRAFQRGIKPIGVSLQIKKNIPTRCATETWNLVFHTTDINNNSSLKQRKEEQFGLILLLSFPLLKEKMELSKEKSKM